MKVYPMTVIGLFLLSTATSAFAQFQQPSPGIPLDPVTGNGTIVVPNPNTPSPPGAPGGYYPNPNYNCDTNVQGAKILSAMNDPEILALRLEGLLSRGIVSRALSEEISNEIATGSLLFTKMVVFRQNGQPNLNTIANYLNDFQSLELRIELIKAGEAIERELLSTSSTADSAFTEMSRFTPDQLTQLKELSIKYIRKNSPLQSAANALLESRMMLRTERESMGMSPETVKKLRELKASKKPITLKELVDAKLTPWGRMWFKIQLRKDWLKSTMLPSALIRSMSSKHAVTHEELFRLMGYNNLVGAANRNGEFYTKIKTLLKEEQTSVINDLFASQAVRYQLKLFYEQQIDVTQLITSLEGLSQGSAPLIPLPGQSEGSLKKLLEMFVKKPETAVDSPILTETQGGSVAALQSYGRTHYSSLRSNYGEYGNYGSPGFVSAPVTSYYGASGAFPANKIVFEVTQQIAVDLFLLRDLAGVRVGVPGRFQEARNKLDLLKKEYIVLEEALAESKIARNKEEIKRLTFELNQQKNVLMNHAKETQEYATQVVTSYMNWSLHANLDKGILGNETVSAIALPEPLRMSDPELAKQWSSIYDEAFAIAVNPLYRKELEPAVMKNIRDVKEFFISKNTEMKQYWEVDFFETPLGQKSKEQSRRRFQNFSQTLFKMLAAPGQLASKDPMTQKLVNYTFWTTAATFIGTNSNSFWTWVKIFIETAAK